MPAGLDSLRGGPEKHEPYVAGTATKTFHSILNVIGKLRRAYNSSAKNPTKDPPMLKRLLTATVFFVATVLAFFFPSTGTAQSEKSIYYWISHGSPNDPVWTLFLQGAEQWAKDTGNDVRTSFHSGDVPSHQEAFRAAITAHAKGIVTSTPDPGSLTKVTAEAHAAGIPVIILNTDDKASGRDAYVGGDNVAAGRRLA
jgi:simple sugar transport system substrate-binding protein